MTDYSSLPWSTSTDWNNAQTKSRVVNRSDGDYPGTSDVQLGFDPSTSLGNNLVYAFLMDANSSPETDMTGSWSMDYYSPTYGQTGLNNRDAINFNGNGSHGALDHYYNNTYTHGLTCVCWLKWDGTKTTSNARVFNYDASEYWRLGIDGNDYGYMYGRDGSSNAGGSASASTAFPSGSWALMVGVIDTTNGEVRYYENGNNLKDTYAGYDYAEWGTGSTRYGFVAEGSEATSQNGTTNGSGVNGDYGFAAVWHRVLSGSEIQTLYDIASSGSLTTAQNTS